MAFLTKTLTVTSGSDHSPIVDFTEWVDWDGTEVAMAANNGESTASNILFRDEDGVIQDYVGSGQFLLGHNVVKITVGSNMLYRGRIDDLDHFGGRQIAFRSKEINVTTEDYNGDLDGIAVHGWDRGEETDKERVQGLIASYLSANPRATTSLNGSNYVSSSNTQTLVAKTYTAMTPREVLREIAEDVDKNFFVTVDGELWWDGWDSAAYVSTLRISDDLADTVLSPLTYFPWDPHGKRFVREQLSHLRTYYGSGSGDKTPSLRVSNPSIAVETDYWEGIWNDSAAISEENATNRATKRLNYFGKDEYTYTCAIGPMTGDEVWRIKAGQTIQFKAKKARGGRNSAGTFVGQSFRTVRISEVRWKFIGVDQYIAHLTLDRPRTLGFPRGTLPPRAAPECPTPEPDSILHTWSFAADNLDDGTSTYDSGFKWSPNATGGALDPGFGSTYGYPTATSGPCDLIPATAGTTYTFSARMNFKYNRTVSFFDIRWFNGGTMLGYDRVADGNDYAADVVWDVGGTFTAPAGTTGFRFAGPTVGLCYAIDDIVVGTVAAAPPDSDPFCLPGGGGDSPYFARSDDPRFDAVDQNPSTRLITQPTNSSAITLAVGDIVVADLTDEGAVTTTTTASYTDGMVGLVLEGGAVGATLLVGWVGHFGYVNSGTVGIGDTLTTSAVAGQGAPQTGRVEGSFARVLGVDDSDRPTIVEWWGIPDNATGSGGSGFVLSSLGGKEVIQSHGNTGTTETVDLANGNWHIATLNANCTFTFSGATNGTGCSFRLRLHQDATGSRTATWPASVVWPAATAPTLSTAANAVDLLSFETSDGGTIWYGSYLSAGSGGGSALTVKDIDGTPTATSVDTIRFSNGLVTDDGGGQVTVAAAASVHSHGDPTAGFRGASVYRTSNWTYGNNNNFVDWQAEEYDTDGLWVIGTPQRFTIPADWDGLMVRLMLSAITADDDGYFELKIFLNGDTSNPVAVAQDTSNNSNTSPIAITRPMQVATGDYFTAAMKGPSAGAGLAADFYSPYFSIELVQGTSALDILDLTTAETDDSLVLAPDGAGGVEFRAETGGGSGAPTTVNYLVGTADVGLSAEIVVGTTPGGELGGTWASPTVDATHSGSTHSAASDTHVADTSAAHVASSIGFTPTGTVAATDVQAAIAEVAAEAGAGAYTDEQSQDAVGTILTDSATIDFTYTDATPAITAAVKFVGCLATRTTDQTGVVTATETAVVFNATDVFDTHAFHDPTTNANRITIPSGLDGKYSFSAFVPWDTNSTGLRQIYLRKNGTTVYAYVRHSATAGTTDTYQTITFGPIPLVATDYMEVMCIHTSGANRTLGAAGAPAYFGCTYLGA